MSEELKLGIGRPLSWPYVASDFHRSFIMLEKPPETEVIDAISGPIHEMRNYIVIRALELGCTKLLFIDADHAFNSDLAFRLLDHNVPIVGGLCFKKQPPFDPTMFSGEHHNLRTIYDWEDGLVEVTATGTGCLLIDMEVFEEIDYPWFEWTRLPSGKEVGEDVGFCYKANKAGYKIYVDTTVEAEHITQMRVNKDMHRLFRELQKRDVCMFSKNRFFA